MNFLTKIAKHSSVSKGCQQHVPTRWEDVHALLLLLTLTCKLNLLAFLDTFDITSNKEI